MATHGWTVKASPAEGWEVFKGAMGEISNFYNFPPRMLIFDTLTPPAITMHARMFH